MKNQSSKNFKNESMEWQEEHRTRCQETWGTVQLLSLTSYTSLHKLLNFFLSLHLNKEKIVFVKHTSLDYAEDQRR